MKRLRADEDIRPKPEFKTIELLQDIQTSINQVESGHGIEHSDAKAAVLKRIRR